MDLTVRGDVAYAATGGKSLDEDKDSVVFVHGVGQDHTIWVLPTRYFARHDRNVLAVDLPGHGRSAGVPLRTIEEMADWLIAVLDTAGVKSAAVVGHSMGSLVALDVGARHPDRVRSIAMIGVSVPLPVADPLMNSAGEESHDAVEMLTYWGHSNRARIGGNTTPGMWMTGSSLRLWERAGPGVIHTDLRACDTYDAGLVRATGLACPALLLLAGRDRMTPLPAAKAVIDAIPDQQTVVFDGAGHALFLERPDRVLDELVRIV